MKKDKLVKMKIITHRIKNFKVGDKQTFVEVYPKHRKHERSDIDIFRLTINSFDEKRGTEELREVDMTPDEAIAIAGILTTAVEFWLINYKPYWDFFQARQRGLNKQFESAKIRRRK